MGKVHNDRTGISHKVIGGPAEEEKCTSGRIRTCVVETIIQPTEPDGREVSITPYINHIAGSGRYSKDFILTMIEGVLSTSWDAIPECAGCNPKFDTDERSTYLATG